MKSSSLLSSIAISIIILVAPFSSTLGFVPHVFSTNRKFNDISKSKSLKVGLKFIDNNGQSSMDRLMDKFNADIQREADQYGPTRAHSLLTILRESMQALNPNYDSYRIVLHAYATWNDHHHHDRKRKTDADHVVSDDDDLLVYNAGKRALELFDQVKVQSNEDDSRIEIDTELYNVVLQAISSTVFISEDFGNRALKLLLEMEESSDSDISNCHARIAPDEETYRYVVAILCKCGLVDDAHALVHRILDSDSNKDSHIIRLSPDLFRKIAYAYSFKASAGDMHWNKRRNLASKSASAIESLLSLMKKQHIEVDEYIYNPLISCLTKCASIDSTQQAEHYFYELLSYIKRTDEQNKRIPIVGIQRARHSFHDVLNSWLRSKSNMTGEKSSQLLKYVLTFCEEEGYKSTDIINVITVNTVIGAWSKTKSVRSADEADALLSCMLDLGIAPTIHTYCAIINTWVSCKMKDKQQILDRAKILLHDSLKRFKEGDQNMAPHNRLFTSIIRAFAHCGEPGLANEVLMMSEDYFKQGYKDSKPDASTYTGVITAYAKSRQPDAHLKAEDLIHYMINSRDPVLLPNSYSFSNYLVALSNSQYSQKGDKAKKAMEIFDSLYPFRIETHMLNNVMKVCSMCRNDQTDSRKIAFQTAAMAFTKLHKNEDGLVRSDSYTYGFFIKLCSNLLDDEQQKKQLIYKAFHLCQKHRKVNKEVLFQLEKALPNDDFQNIMKQQKNAF